MKKILAIFLIIVSVVGLSITIPKLFQHEEKPIAIIGREEEFFNININYNEEPNSYGIDQYWEVEVSPKSMDYTFTAASELEVTIRYSCMNYVNSIMGEFEGNKGMTIEIEYDENGFGYTKKFLYGSGNLKNVILLSYEAEASSFEEATKKSKGVSINSDNVLDHFKIENFMWVGNYLTPKPSLTIPGYYSYEIERLSIVITMEYELSYYCYTCERENRIKFEAKYSIYDYNVTPLFEPIHHSNFSNVCVHRANEDTIKIENYRILSVKGDYKVKK